MRLVDEWERFIKFCNVLDELLEGMLRELVG